MDKDMKTYLEIREMTDEMVRSIYSLSESLPNSELYQIKLRLRRSLNSVPEKIEKGLASDNKLEKIRSLIKANGALAEIKDYLKLVEELKFGKTSDLIHQVDNVSKLLTRDYPALAI